jgi:mannose-6-phosphate isomerase-like protein (cupin superfamily)
VKIHDLSSEAVEAMIPADLAAMTAPPNSPVEEFTLNESICGIGCFVGQPPWECHTVGDELLHVLAGETEFTISDDDGVRSDTLRAGSVVVVPRGCWHRNSSSSGVTMLYITPSTGNLHSWDAVPARG